MIVEKTLERKKLSVHYPIVIQFCFVARQYWVPIERYVFFAAVKWIFRHLICFLCQANVMTTLMMMATLCHRVSLNVSSVNRKRLKWELNLFFYSLQLIPLAIVCDICDEKFRCETRRRNGIQSSHLKHNTNNEAQMFRIKILRRRNLYSGWQHFNIYLKIQLNDFAAVVSNWKSVATKASKWNVNCSRSESNASNLKYSPGF